MTNTNALSQQLLAANNSFGLTMLTKLAEAHPYQNIFISPASLMQALLMTYNGAQDETAVVMAHALQLPSHTLADLNQAAIPWLPPEDPQITLAVANALWAPPIFPFHPEFKSNMQHFYNAKIENIDFNQPNQAAQIINTWVSHKTQNKITDLLKANDLMGALLVLLNAIYFKGAWQRPFAHKQTKPKPFYKANGTTQTIPMMHQNGKFNYLESDQFQAITLPFGEGALGFTILLPQPNFTPITLLSTFTANDWQQLHARLLPGLARGRWHLRHLAASQKMGNLALPRFKMAYKTRPKAILTDMGMGDAFTGKANFQAMTTTGQPLMISDVIHQTFLEVNEEGAEAAAATAIIMTRGMVASRPFKMTVDRPFICTIQDNTNGRILFIGLIYQPKE